MKRLILIILFLLAACDGGIWNNPYPASESGKSIFYTVFTERPKHLDPAQAYSENEYIYLSQILQTPLQYHYLKRPYTLIPQAARSMPSVRYVDRQGRPLPDNAPAERIAYSIYEIQLRPDLKYQPHPAFAHDAQGKPEYMHMSREQIAHYHALNEFPHTGTRGVTAADYAYQIKRLVHPAIHTPIAGLMSEYIVGLKEYAETLNKAWKENGGNFIELDKYPLPGVEVVNEHTYRIKVKGKYPQFIYWLAMPFFAPMPEEVDRFFAQEGMQQNGLTLDAWPVGSGPYYLAENNPNQRMVLRRNPNFAPESYPAEGEPGDREAGLLSDAGKALPLTDEVVFTLEKETIPYWNKFLQGYYDVAGISSDSFDQAVSMSVSGEATVSDEMKAQGIQLSTSVATSTFYMGFNFLDPVVGGNSERARKLRQALSIAIDYEEFISIFYNGRGLSAQSPIPPGIFGYRDGKAGMNPYVYDWVDGAPRRKSISEARRLLDEAGYRDGIDEKTGQPLVIYLDTTASGAGNKSRLDWLRKQLDKLNIQLVPRVTDYNRFQDKIRRGDTQLFYFGWNADYPDPENFLFLLYGPQGKVAKGGENASNYSSPEFDRLFDQMKNMSNGPQRQLIIDRMLDILHRDSPWIWGFHPKDFVLHHGWEHNSKPNKMANNSMKYLRVDPAQRDALRKAWNKPAWWPLIALVLMVTVAGWWIIRVMRQREDAR